MIIAKSIVISVTLGTNAHHHHLGVLPSAIPAMASEIQPMGRWLETSGTRASSGGGAWSFTEDEMTASAISALLSLRLRRPGGPRQGGRHGRLRDVRTDFHFSLNTPRSSPASRGSRAWADLGYAGAPGR